MFKTKKSTKSALLLSAISLLLCCSMLVGTTFAWFTDEVTSSNNVIQSGSLDAEMYWGEAPDAITNDASQGAIFNYDLWEPGFTQVRYVKIANVGNLAFRFQLNIIPQQMAVYGEPNLAEVIDVYMFPATATPSRADIATATPVGTLADLMADGDGATHGVLLPAEGEGSTDVTYEDPNAPRGEITYCIVLKMQESAGNEYQNLSVGGGFKVQLLATQYTWENDSFDHKYDENSRFEGAPVANVTPAAPETINATIGMGGTAVEMDLVSKFIFKTTETRAQAEMSPYRYFHADFVVKVDQEIPAGAAALAGYYAAYCDDYNNGNWVALMDESNPIPANTELRLLDMMLNGGSMNYQELCQYVPEFHCGVVDMSNGTLAGTTLTVELRLYETTLDPSANSGSANIETGEFITVGTYTYTFGAKEVSTADELAAALAAGGNFKLGANIDMGGEKLTVAKNAVLDLNGHVLSGTCNTGSGSLIAVKNGVALDIKDTSSAQTGKITYAQGTSNVGWTVYVEGKLNLYSGTIELTGDSWSIGYGVDVRPNAWGTKYNDGTIFHMYGGKIVSSDGAIRVACNSSDSYTDASSSFIMDGGIIDAAWDGIFVQQLNDKYDTLNVTINNGTIISDLSPIRVYAPVASSVNAGTAKPMTITINGGNLSVDGTPDMSRVWHTMGKIVIGGGFTLDDLNQYATITIA